MQRRPTTFTVGVAGTKLKVECRVYQSQREMLAAARRFGAKVGNDTMALCEGRPLLMPKGRFAVIFFNRTHLSHGTVAHEMDHAAFCLFARRKKSGIHFLIDQATPAEEQHATVVGELVDGFHRAYGV